MELPEVGAMVMVEHIHNEWECCASFPIRYNPDKSATFKCPKCKRKGTVQMTEDLENGWEGLIRTSSESAYDKKMRLHREATERNHEAMRAVIATLPPSPEDIFF